MRRVGMVMALALVAVGAESVSVSASTEPTSTSTSTSTGTAAEALAYAEPGPHPVGVTTLTLAGGLVVEVWYPAAPDTAPAIESYDVRDFVPEGVRNVLVGDLPATFSYAASRDAAGADGAHPMVVFSHGFSGMRLQSSFLTSHLASWGFVVASADHVARDLTHVLEGTATGDGPGTAAEVWTAYEAVLDAAEAPWSGQLDDAAVVLVGHSAGGATVLRAGGDDRADGVVVLAGAQPADVPNVTVPTLFMAGSNDGVVPAEATADAFWAATPPSWYWELDSVGHNGFDDFCTIGGGRGLIGLAEASGLGPFLDSQPELRTLGLDGCLPPNRPVIETFGSVRHAVTAFARWRAGLDPEPVQLDSAPNGDPAATIEVRP